MSTLDGGGNSNGEVPVHLWYIAKFHPRLPEETPGQYFDRLTKLKVSYEN